MATHTHWDVLETLLYPAQVDGAEDECEECYYPFEEEVEKQDTTGTAEEAVDYYAGLSSCGLRCCVAVSCRRIMPLTVVSFDTCYYF